MTRSASLTPFSTVSAGASSVTGPGRPFRVEEGLLLVAAGTLEPLSAGGWEAGLGGGVPAAGREGAVWRKPVASPPRTTLAGQLDAIRAGRALAEQAAARRGAHVVALPTAPGPPTPLPAPDTRRPRTGEQVEPAAAEQFAPGFHIHVGIESRREAVTVLDRIGIWLPTLLALSANSPFWRGADTGYASYRYQANLSWPVEGSTGALGRPLRPGAPVDADAPDLVARLSEHHPTLEVQIADVCLNSADAAVVAALTRALVETTARNWRAEAPDVPTPVLQAWSWTASRSGVEDQLIDPITHILAPAGDVVNRLLDFVRPVLSEFGEEQTIESVVTDILHRGSGARHQRRAFALRHETRDVVAAALDATHAEPFVPLFRAAATEPPADTAEPLPRVVA